MEKKTRLTFIQAARVVNFLEREYGVKGHVNDYAHNVAAVATKELGFDVTHSALKNLISQAEMTVKGGAGTGEKATLKKRVATLEERVTALETILTNPNLS